ncbi:dihydroneopterin aldolase [Candidatus Gracilibacteria bacterium]|nr:dihydroneopterin aldolase [Candidatus Gracilibacteria bacterium]MCF7819394.1 dihydroneopterin aldolase [Candidatus Gracilibacteria bacterium]
MKFELRNIPLFVRLGTTKSERNTPQKVLVSINFEYDTHTAVQTDDIVDTIDYYQIRQWIQNFGQEKEFHLLETLHEAMLGKCQQQFSEAKNIVLCIEKFPFSEGSIIVSNEH